MAETNKRNEMKWNEMKTEKQQGDIPKMPLSQKFGCDDSLGPRTHNPWLPCREKRKRTLISLTKSSALNVKKEP